VTVTLSSNLYPLSPRDKLTSGMGIDSIISGMEVVHVVIFGDKLSVHQQVLFMLSPQTQVA